MFAFRETIEYMYYHINSSRIWDCGKEKHKNKNQMKRARNVIRTLIYAYWRYFDSLDQALQIESHQCRMSAWELCFVQGASFVYILSDDFLLCISFRTAKKSHYIFHEQMVHLFPVLSQNQYTVLPGSNRNLN